MALTSAGVTIPGSSPTTTAATPIQDHWNNLGKSLNPLVVVPTASITTRAALVTARNAEGPAISSAAPMRVHRADAPLGFRDEITEDGTAWRAIGADSWVGGEAVITGAAPAAGARKIRYSGTFLYTTNAFGQFAIAFPAAFPTGLVNLMFTPGDVAGGLGQTAVDTTITTLATGGGQARTPAGAALGGSVVIRVCYIAEGC